MAWQNKASKMVIGQFVRVKAERMVIVRFDEEPIEAKGKSFDGKPQDELQFPVTFWDERSISDRYGEGEAAKIVKQSRGDAKLFPTSGGPLLRELMAEDREESIMGRTFVISHTGTARDTVYKMREVKLPKQAPLAAPVEEEEENEEYEEEEYGHDVGPNPKKDEPRAPTKSKKDRGIGHDDDIREEGPKLAVGEDGKLEVEKKKARKTRRKKQMDEEAPETPVETGEEEDKEKVKFKKEVAKRAARNRAEEDRPDTQDKIMQAMPW